MARLIDGDGINLALVERGQSDKRFKWGETIRYTPSEVQQIINEDMPTVDAVPVVRCKDCKHSGKGILGMRHCKLDMRVRRADWFCADGKRKGGDE